MSFYHKIENKYSVNKVIFSFVKTIYEVMEDVSKEESEEIIFFDEKNVNFSNLKLDDLLDLIDKKSQGLENCVTPFSCVYRATNYSKVDVCKIVAHFMKNIKAETSTLIIAFIYVDLLVNKNRFVLNRNGFSK